MILVLLSESFVGVGYNFRFFFALQFPDKAKVFLGVIVSSSESGLRKKGREIFGPVSHSYLSEEQPSLDPRVRDRVNPEYSPCQP